MGLTAIIPARGGSKRIPRKNLVDLGGKPLVAWTIEAALNAESVERVVVSTEDNEIAEVVRCWGAEVLDRPDGLAEDGVPTREVTLHAIEALGLQSRVALLHPTSPFRTSMDIDAANLWNAYPKAPVVSFTNDELNGAMYLGHAKELRTNGGSFFRIGPIQPYDLPLPNGLDIDYPADLELAREHLVEAA